MLKHIIVLFMAGCCLITAQTAYAIPQWAKSYGESGFYYNTNFAQQTADGGFVVAGQTNSFGTGNDYYSAWVTKLDARGIIVWQKRYGDVGSEYATSIQQTEDSGYIVVGGYAAANSGMNDIWVLKLDTGGSVVWQKIFGGAGYDYATSIQQTADRSYIVAGYTESYGPGVAWVLKLDESGVVLWQKKYVEGSATSIQQTADGGYILASSINNGTVLLQKLDASGNVVWQNAYDDIGYESASSIQQTADGGYILAGIIYPPSQNSSAAWVVKLDASGNVLWQKAYGGTGYDAASSIQQTEDGGYIVAGTIDTDSSGAGNPDTWVLKLDAGGAVVWQKAYGGTGYDSAYSIQQTADGGYIVAGYADSLGGAWVLKLDCDGNIPGAEFISDTAASVADSTASVYSSFPNVVAVGPDVCGSNDVSGWSVSQVSAGYAHTVGLTTGGTVLAAGCNDYGQCNVSSWNNITQVSAGYAHTVGLKPDRTVVAAGDNSADQCDVSGWTNIVQVAAGEFHSVGLKADGTVVVVGCNEGEEGHHDYGQCDADEISSWTNIVQVAAGKYQTIGLRSDGTVVAAGCYYDGHHSEWGCDVELFTNIVQVSAGYGHTVGLKSDGTVIATGGNSFGKCNVASWSNIIQVAAGEYHTVGLKADGTVVAVGDNEGGRCDVTPENGFTTIVQVAASQRTFGLKPIDQILIPVSTSCTATGTSATPVYTSAQASTQAYSDSWEPVDSGVNNTLTGMWGTDHQNIIAIGDSGLIRQSTDGGQTWTTRASSTTSDLYGIWGDGTGNVYVVGDSGTIRYSSDGGVTWSTPLSSGTSNNLKGVWGSSGSNIYAVGDAGTIVHSSDSGVTWSVMASGTLQNLNKVWGSSASDVYAVGDGGTIVHYNGSGWSSLSMQAAGGRIRLRGAGNTRWNDMESGVSTDLSGIWGSSAGEIFVVGKAGKILHYDGTGWSEMVSGTRCNLNAVAGTTASAQVFGGAAKNVFAAGDNGTILHYDGTGWSAMDSGTVDDLYSAWESVNTHRYVTGTDGLIQKTGVPAVVGYVCNACTGAVVASATIDVNNNARQVETGSSGYYTPLSCDPGLNLIRVTASGMSTAQETRGFPASYSQVPQHVLLMPTDVAQYQWCIAGAVNRKVLLDTYDFSYGLANIDVRLLKDDGCGGWTEVGRVLTSQYGQYRFTVTAGATYKVVLALAPGYSIVQPSSPPSTWNVQGFYQIVMPRVSEGTNPQRFDFELAVP